MIYFLTSISLRSFAAACLLLILSFVPFEKSFAGSWHHTDKYHSATPAETLSKFMTANSYIGPYRLQFVNNGGKSLTFQVQRWNNRWEQIGVFYTDRVDAEGVCLPEDVDTTESNLGQCSGPKDCSAVKPVTASNNIVSGCYDGCAYSYQTTLKNWENALAETQHEYLPTGAECDGETELADASLYTDTPDGVCTTILGLTTCQLDNGCSTYNGVEVCPEDGKDNVCGTYNGTVVCYDKAAPQNCGLVNGSAMCVDSAHNIIPADSPDNPINGGNNDGNETNDVFSKDEITNNSGDYTDFKKQVKQSIAVQTATKSLDKKSSDQQDNSNPDFKIPEKYSGANDIQTSSTNYYNSLANVPIVQALNISATVNNDNCPPLQFDDLAYVGTQGTNVHCEFVDENRDSLEILFKALWILSGIFIIFLG